MLLSMNLFTREFTGLQETAMSDYLLYGRTAELEKRRDLLLHFYLADEDNRIIVRSWYITSFHVHER